MTGRIQGNPAVRALFLLVLGALLAYMVWRAFPIVEELPKG